jgi:hypothetical protein
LVGRHGRRRKIRKTRSRWKDIKMVVKEIRWENVGWIYLA